MNRRSPITLCLLIILTLAIVTPVYASGSTSEVTNVLLHEMKLGEGVKNHEFELTNPYDGNFRFIINGVEEDKVHIEIIDSENRVILSEVFKEDGTKSIAATAGEYTIRVNVLEQVGESNYSIKVLLPDDPSLIIQDSIVPLADSSMIKNPIPYELIWGGIGITFCLIFLNDYRKKLRKV